MSLAELKAELDRLSPEERGQLTTYLVSKSRVLTEQSLERLSKKIDDKNTSNWMTLDEAEKRLFPEG